MGNLRGLRTVILLSLIVGLNFVSCDNTLAPETNDVDESLKFVPAVTPIEEASNIKLTVHRGKNSYFNLEFEGIDENSIISNGMHEGWCIDYNKPIDSNQGVYEGLQLYSSYLAEEWKELNYFLNIKEVLRDNHPELTFKEIQIVIWSLMPYPEFDLDTISNDEIPGTFITDGQRNFDEDMVREILSYIDENVDNFDFSEGSKFAVVVETPEDVQTVITVAE